MRTTRAHQMAHGEAWLYARITDSKFLNATLTEIRTSWSLGDIHDAWRRVDYYEELKRQNKPN